MSLERRIARLEQVQERRRQQRLYDAITVKYGCDGRELWAEVERFLAMSLEDQLAEVDRLAPDLIETAACTAAEIAETKAILREHYRS